MAVCPHCHVIEPCFCEGIPPKERPPMIVVERAIPDWVRPPAPVNGPSAGTPSVPSGRGRERCQVARCKAQVPPGMLVCGTCADKLYLDLSQIPGLALALEAAHAKQLHFGTTRPTLTLATEEEEAPVPFNPVASTTAAVLLDTLVAWSERIAAERHIDLPPREVLRPLSTWTVLGAWLCAQVSWLRSSPLGPEAVEKLGAAVGAARSVVDRPSDMVYAGPCNASTVDGDGLHQVCGEDLYARAGEISVTCTSCGAKHALSDRRQWLLGKVEDMLLPASELARAIDGLGVDVTPTAIWKWKERGRLTPHGTDGRGHPLYRVGDVMDVVNAAAARGTTRR